MSSAPAASLASNGTGLLRWLAMAALLALLYFQAAQVPVFLYGLLSYPLDYFVSEGDQVFYAHQLLRGGTIYGDSQQLPFFGHVYPPLYPWLNQFCGWFVTPTLASQRAFACLPLAGMLALLYLACRRLGLARAASAAAALALPATYSLSQYLVMPRCDGWMTLFTFASLLLLLRSETSRRDALLAGLCAALALYGKQTALPGLLAVWVHLLLRDRKAGLLAGAAAVGACVVLLALALWRFGTPMLDAMFHLLSSPRFLPARFESVFLREGAAVGVLAAATLARMAWHVKRKTWDLLDTYCLGHALILGLLLYDGTSGNYLLPLFPGLVLATATLLHELDALAPHRWVPAAALALACAHVWLQGPYAEVFRAPPEPYLSEARRAAEFLAGTDEPVYAERFWGPVGGRASLAQDFVEPAHLRSLPPGALRKEVLERPFQERRFARVLLYAKGFHYPGFADAVRREYREAGRGEVKVCFDTCGAVEIVYWVRKEE